ncbi:glyoxylase-like metal-dependent hydrolase (beta-lactamase superfamily II) [Roseovarius halotolerans]|uniref:Hydroxyacylglutathione hydrolase n=1 Tax=Roseovarius halotolerans TaxID=505353 RepID=A0A1X6Z060_9RHOB|nr:MBL fold metallo-hydrolase [Roseovarius halotolerans]RKT32494.1 glyoxylase-like metal-dependent hydrolase (beta-lactamase superfamily II) [Roseovarius halotolerans]SLN36524.1 Hydroxyacylglutathione hydrolase [Roseovarius halotolerans]
MDGAAEPLRYPWRESPDEGEAITVAPGVLWIRLPLPMALDHVNVYALDEGDSWTVVDTGIQSARSTALWEKLLTGPLQGRPVSRVILTHHHPDHIGMAGWLMERFGAELVATRTAWLLARMLILDVEQRPSDQALAYWRRAGMDPAIYEARKSARPFNFADSCHPIPVGYTRVKQGDTLRAGGRAWDVHIGHGHAPEHLTLWSRDDNLVIAGDQIIASISPNLGVYPTEPDADPVGEWLESCGRLAALAHEDHLVLSGHKLPFTGLPVRMRQLIENHHGALDRLRLHLASPKTAAECFAPLFKRRIDEGTYGLALVESVAHLNHLYHAGEVTRSTRAADGAWLWQAKG